MTDYRPLSELAPGAKPGTAQGGFRIESNTDTGIVEYTFRVIAPQSQSPDGLDYICMRLASLALELQNMTEPPAVHRTRLGFKVH